MKKIGIMGGTFDPIHLAHLTMAQCALKQKQLEEIWFMPSKVPPHKKEKTVSDEKLRSLLVRLAIQEEPHFFFSDFELQRKETTYTARTLTLLKKKYPENLFYFIMGGDSLFQFSHWYQPEKILERAVILAAGRSGIQTEKLQKQAASLSERFGGTIELLQMPDMNISSSCIRERLAAKKSVREYLPARVYNYITEHHCYQGGEQNG